MFGGNRSGVCLAEALYQTKLTQYLREFQLLNGKGYIGLRDSGEPDDETIRETEGWISGRPSYNCRSRTFTKRNSATDSTDRDKLT